jgi:predicted nucleic acid-binding protein
MRVVNEFGAFILDSSVTLSWFLPDEVASVSRGLLHETAQNGAWVPSIWPLEVGNGLSIAMKRRRISTDLRTRAFDRLGLLPIRVDRSTVVHAWRATLELADRFHLTLYDACYLELAARRNLPLATLDKELRTASHKLGIELLG